MNTGAPSLLGWPMTVVSRSDEHLYHTVEMYREVELGGLLILSHFWFSRIFHSTSIFSTVSTTIGSFLVFTEHVSIFHSLFNAKDPLDSRQNGRGAMVQVCDVIVSLRNQPHTLIVWHTVCCLLYRYILYLYRTGIHTVHSPVRMYRYGIPVRTGSYCMHT